MILGGKIDVVRKQLKEALVDGWKKSKLYIREEVNHLFNAPP